MRGVVGIVIAFIVFLVLAMIGLSYYHAAAESFAVGKERMVKGLTIEEPYSFDINTLLLRGDKTTINADMTKFLFTKQADGETPFCSALYECVAWSVKNNGMPCSLPAVPAFTDITDLPFDKCGNNVQLTEQLGETKRLICSFGQPPASKNFINESLYETGPFKHFEPDIHGCVMPDDFATHSDKPYYAYSPDYGNRIYPFGRNGGQLRVVVVNGTNEDSWCKYDLYVCGQEAIGQMDTPTGYIFELFQNLPEENFACGGWDSTTGRCKATVPKPFEINFNSGEAPNQWAVISAIEAGLWQWNRQHISAENFINDTFPEELSTYKVDDNKRPVDRIQFELAPTKVTGYDASKFANCYFNGATLDSKPDEQLNILSNWPGGGGSDTGYTKLKINVALYFQQLETNSEYKDYPSKSWLSTDHKCEVGEVTYCPVSSSSWEYDSKTKQAIKSKGCVVSGHDFVCDLDAKPACMDCRSNEICEVDKGSGKSRCKGMTIDVVPRVLLCR